MYYGAPDNYNIYKAISASIYALIFSENMFPLNWNSEEKLWVNWENYVKTQLHSNIILAL